MPIPPPPRPGRRAAARLGAMALAVATASVLVGCSTEAPELVVTGPVSGPALHPSVDGYDAGRVVVTTADAAMSFDVRIARTDAERQHGLMEVVELPEGVGMWFVYDAEHDGGFWMKNTLVDLDIVYVDGAGLIVDIAEAVPCPPDEACPTYPSAAPFAGVLEVAGGTMAELGADVGDRVELVDG